MQSEGQKKAHGVLVQVGGARRQREEPGLGPLLAELPGRAEHRVKAPEPGLVEEVVLVLHLPQQAVVQDARRLCMHAQLRPETAGARLIC